MISGGERLRDWLLSSAVAAMVFSVLHHADRVIRDNLSGWPFRGEIAPFTFSLPERNVEFYEKRGFKVSDASTIRSLRMWAMLRTPRSPATEVETQPEAPRKEDA